MAEGNVIGGNHLTGNQADLTYLSNILQYNYGKVEYSNTISSFTSGTATLIDYTMPSDLAPVYLVLGTVTLTDAPTLSSAGFALTYPKGSGSTSQTCSFQNVSGTIQTSTSASGANTYTTLAMIIYPSSFVTQALTLKFNGITSSSSVTGISGAGIILRLA